MIDFKKLKREWKTAVVAVLGLLVEVWDSVLSYQLSLVDPLIDDKHRWLLHLAIPILMLILRRWKDVEDPDVFA